MPSNNRLKVVKRTVVSESEEEEAQKCAQCGNPIGGEATSNSGGSEEEEDDTTSSEEGEAADDKSDSDSDFAPEGRRRRKRGRIAAPKDLTESYDDDEYDYYASLPAKERAKIRGKERALAERDGSEDGDVPWRFRILALPVGPHVQSMLLDRVEALRSMGQGTGEYHKLNNWMHALGRLPLGRPRSLVSPRKDVAAFLKRLHEVMDREVYGHREAKNQLLMTFAKWVSNPDAGGIVLGLQGPPGVGKTTLIKDGVCRALGLPYAFVPLGGANDSSYLDGHSYTYEGSTWGKIAGSLMEAGCSNPVLVFDELDKVAGNVRGSEIYNVLIHLTDPAQNEAFNDKYFAEVPIDLSKCIIVFTYNEEEAVHPVLRDRMVRLRTSDYARADKVAILKQYMMPRILASYGLVDQVTVPDATVEHIVTRVGGSAGMRDVKRAVENMVGNLNVHRLLGDASILKDAELTVKFPCAVTRAMADHYLDRDASMRGAPPLPDSVAHIYM